MPPAHLQVLCVFNNSQTVRAPLALALSVNDCRTWEPLAIIEEDVKGALPAGSGGSRAAGRAGAGWLHSAQAQTQPGRAGATARHGTAQLAASAPGLLLPHPPTRPPTFLPPLLPPPLLPAAGNFSSPTIVEWADDTVKVAYTVWGQGLKLATVKLATVESH